ncbi:single-stranded DNA-binding protein [candidate division WWE3 bacterium CG10_big_fil_rev_8_21_14_0_10_32_10]|uniref:Single-stranded DNA-binding protein n=1 Tax=candidate division WWE3 bacterium CG10_big_fil_rev_8_21_14_0_10_32_10 TaxID=1975090 RepID=A0A2H0RBR0_UNCKA|nr:MAG: single-stranded DNA-binding protein [candidate division WWE3 bacterium CG10_big_fil_rev_8_21_14_0_10_32_10]
MSVRSLNRATLVGNLTADPVLRTTNNGTPVATFAVATNRSYTDSSGEFQDAADFHNCVGFGKTAEICNDLLQKGSMVYVEGRLQTRKWDDADGKTNYRTEIVIEKVILLARGKPGGNTDEEYSSGSTDSSASAPLEETTTDSGKSKKVEAPSEEVSSEDIPF